MAKIFSKEQVNRDRQIELDLAKCLAIIFMIFLHCLFVTTGFKHDISVPMTRAIQQLLGGPFAAPVFMFAMGVGFVYSKNQKPFYLISRGIKIMLLGVAVNIGEFFIPHFLTYELLGKKQSQVFPIAEGMLLFCVDILAFAGLSMITIGIFKKLKLKSWHIVIIAVVLSVIGSFVRFYDFKGNLLDLLTGYFIGSARGFTAFPLFNGFIFPAVGMLFGELYIRCSNKKKLFCLSPLALVVSITYFVATWFIPNGFLSGDIHYYYFMTTIDAVFCLICVYGVIGLCYFISLILPNSIKTFVSKTSGNLNTIYIIQWFIIPITYILICYCNRNVKFNDISLIIIAIIEIVVCIAIAAGYKYVLKKGNGEK